MRAFKSADELRSFLPPEHRFETHTAVLGEGEANPDFVIIKKQPSLWDLGKKLVFMGEDGIAIRRGLLGEGIRHYAMTTFPFIRPNESPKLDLLRTAEPVVTEEIRRVGSKKFLIFGADTAKLLPIFTQPVTKLNDMLNRNIVLGDYMFRIVHHPNHLANSPALYGEFLRAARELKEGNDTLGKARPPKSENYYVIQDAMQARKVLKRLPRRVACDVESTGLDVYQDRIITIQLCGEPGLGFAFPWDLLSPREWAGHLAGHDLVFQNGSYDAKILATHGVHVKIAEDTMLMHSIVDETPGTHSLDVMSQKYLGVDKWGEMVNYDDMESNDIETLGRYGARDTDLTLRLANVFRPVVLKRYVTQVLHRAQNAVVKAELRGVKIDREKAFQFQNEIEGHLHDLQQRLADTYDLANANSPKQVAELLYTRLGIPPQKDKGKVSTSSPALSGIVDVHPVIRDIFEYRHLTKANGTYVKNILTSSEYDGRYHADFRLAATETGRLAEKLLMLIPRSDDLVNPDLGKQYQVRLRELFIPDEGHVMIGADYSGLEVTMAAFLTGDRQLIEDIKNQLDTHSAVAIQAFHLDEPLEPYETLKKRVSAAYAYQRELAKRGTFTWLYGGTEAAIAKNVGTDYETAKRILSTLRERYPGVAAWQEAVKGSVERDGSVSTPWGRTRRFLFHPGLGRQVLEGQLRESINTPNQGMASDMNLAAFAQLSEENYDMLFPFHDANYLQAPIEKAERTAARVKSAMENVLSSPVPFRADVKMGLSWAEL